MAQQISASVGKGGVNKASDVMVVQFHLSHWYAASHLRARLVAPPVSGECDPATVTAIGVFQQVILGFGKPDYRVDPNGETFKRLIGPVALEPPTKVRTDYTAKSALRKRAELAIFRGDKYVRSIGLLSTEYHHNFDDFAARVAHELRHDIVYRSDGGRIARGLVRASGDLKLIHQGLRDANMHNGDLVRLEAHLFRRRDAVASNRWVMSIRFRPSVSTVHGEEVEITSDPVVLKKLLCTAADKALSSAALVAADIPGEQGKRIRKMVEIADRLDCHRATQLWYYNRAVAVEYFTWRTTDARRREMTSATSGRTPFDGHVLGKGEWRLFPFKWLAQKYGSGDSSLRNSQIRSYLLDVDFAIFMTLSDIDTEMRRSAALLDEMNKLPKGGRSMYGLAEPFLKHLVQLQKSPDHLYSAYK